MSWVYELGEISEAWLASADIISGSSRHLNPEEVTHVLWIVSYRNTKKKEEREKQFECR